MTAAATSARRARACRPPAGASRAGAVRGPRGARRSRPARARARAAAGRCCAGSRPGCRSGSRPRTAALSGAGGPGAPALRIRREDAFYRRLGAGTAGLAESYMAGDWDSRRPGRPVHRVRPAPADAGAPAAAARCAAGTIPRQPAAERGHHGRARGATSSGTTTCPTTCSRCSWTPTMTYSSALFEPGDTLADAQQPQDRRAAGPDRRRARAPRCWRSAPAGASWPCGPRPAAPG